jgi:photosystem II stability/assembly factor-like uncharacterized protein
MKYNRIIFVIILMVFEIFNLTAQFMYKPSSYEISRSPKWAREMYSDNPDFHKVVKLYNEYFSKHEFIKNYNTQFYKRWKKQNESYVTSDGTIHLPDINSRLRESGEQFSEMSKVSKREPKWKLLGPVQVFNSEGTPGHEQTNVYSLDQSSENSDIMYCGTEPGEVYRSIDKGKTWTNISLHQDFGGGVNAVETIFDNDSIVFAGGGLGVFRSDDAGKNWTNVIPINYKNIAEILAHPSYEKRVFACTDDGFYVSLDKGLTWNKLFAEKTYDVKCHPLNPDTMYLVKNNPQKRICEFFRSEDGGLTWTIQNNGWFESVDEGRNDGGARIAVTEANPSLVFAYLIGEAKGGDLGFIGLYKSTDSGKKWESITGTPGGPYSDEHPNLAIGWPGWDYHQGFYNCALMVSNTDENSILIGGLNLWKSTDGGKTWAPHAGYRGGPLRMHVDVQDMRASKNEYWVTTDGGIYFSTDFFVEQPEFVMKGIHGSDYWGFGSGWNEDVLVGGLYHNGNLANYEKYNTGEFLALGGGEAPTGYINPGNSRKAYFSDIGGKIIPLNIFDPVSSFSFGKSPNESYWSASSSEMEFDYSCYNIVYIGNENKIWKTTDGGSNFVLVQDFGKNVVDRINYIEFSRKNPDVIYCTQQMNDGSNGILYKTIDGGKNWTNTNIPPGYAHRMLITIDPLDANKLWLAYPSSGNSEKIYKTSDGGNTWQNLSTSALDDHECHSIINIAGTKGGVYYCTNKSVFYRNDTMPDWKNVSEGLPYFFNSNIARPFYRDSKIRIASYGKGIWEARLEEEPQFIIPQIMTDKLEANFICEIDSFYFDDYSVVNHEGVKWKWYFENGAPSFSEKRNPAVLFTSEGNHAVRMELTDHDGNIYKDSMIVTVQYFKPSFDLNEGFESGTIPVGWFYFAGENGGTWTFSDKGAWGKSNFSAVFRNFDYDALGGYSDLRVKSLLKANTDNKLIFDIAYAEYGYPYSDTLEILISEDCGKTFNSLYYKGGQKLATHPNMDQVFIPGEIDWRSDTIDLPRFENETELVIAFRNHGHWGNNLYLDNINTYKNTVNNKEISNSNLNFFPNPVKSGDDLTIVSDTDKYTLKIFDENGRLILSENIEGQINKLKLPSNLKAGQYYLNFIGEKHIANRILTVIE